VCVCLLTAAFFRQCACLWTLPTAARRTYVRPGTAPRVHESQQVCMLEVKGTASMTVASLRQTMLARGCLGITDAQQILSVAGNLSVLYCHRADLRSEWPYCAR
jgi:hypothetical protein